LTFHPSNSSRALVAIGNCETLENFPNLISVAEDRGLDVIAAKPFLVGAPLDTDLPSLPGVEEALALATSLGVKAWLPEPDDLASPTWVALLAFALQEAGSTLLVGQQLQPWSPSDSIAAKVLEDLTIARELRAIIHSAANGRLLAAEMEAALSKDAHQPADFAAPEDEHPQEPDNPFCDAPLPDPTLPYFQRRKALVKYVLDECEGGRTHSRIADQLNSAGQTTSVGGPWDKQKVSRLIRSTTRRLGGTR